MLRLPLLSDAARHDVLVRFNETARDYPKDARLPDLFVAQVDRDHFIIEALQIQRDSKAIAGGAAKIGEEFHHPDPTAHGPSGTHGTLS